MSLLDLIEKRNKAVTDARKLVDAADARTGDAKGKLTAEERQSYDRAMADQRELKTQIDERQALESAETELRSSAGRKTSVEQPGSEQRAQGEVIKVEFRGKKMSFRPGTKEHSLASQNHNDAFRNYLTGERRTAASFANDVLADGGYLHAPVQFNAMLLKQLDNLVFVRKNATILPVTTSDTLGTPNLLTDLSDSSWTTEVATVSTDQTLQLSRRDLKPNQLAKQILVSQKLLRTAALSPESIVADRMAYKLAVPEEKAYLAGSGSAQPLGVYTASASGVPTSQDVTCAGSTAIAGDDLIAAKYKLAAQYRAGARWNFHRDGVAQIAKIKDSQNRYMWQVGIAPGQPDTLLGLPIDESEYTPNTFTTGLYVGGLFNWEFYWIADLVTGFEMQRLNELYAANSQVGFIGRKYADGAPVVAQAFARLKLA